MELGVTTTTHADGSATVAVVGEVDTVTAGPFRAAITAAADVHARVLVDLTRTTYLDSAGVKVLYDFVDRGVELELDGAGILVRILTITGLDRELTVHLR